MTVTTATGFTIPSDQSVSDLQLFVTQAHSHGSKAVVTVGGYDGGAYFSSLVSTASSRTSFASSIASFISTYNLDGVDLDWESNSINQVSTSDPANWLLFLQALRAALPSPLLITTAVSVNPSLNGADDYSSFASYAAYLDYIGIMAYDISGSWSETTGPLAPFGNCASGTGFKTAIANWIAKGVPASKILAGIPAYAISFYTSSSTLETTTVGSSSTQYYQAWGGSIPTGSLGSGNWYYKDLVTQGLLSADGLSSGTAGFTRYWDACAGQPFLFNPATNYFISYDDPQSTAQKAKYALAQGLAGVMVFDSMGFNAALYEVLEDSLEGNAPTFTTTSAAKSTTTTTTTKTTTTTSNTKSASLSRYTSLPLLPLAQTTR